MVYFDPNTLNWQTMSKTWMNGCSNKWITECRQFLSDMLEWILPLVMWNLLPKNQIHKPKLNDKLKSNQSIPNQGPELCRKTREELAGPFEV